MTTSTLADHVRVQMSGVVDTWLLPGFVLTNEGRQAIEERDRWLVTSTPQWKEETTPNSKDQLELLRAEKERKAVAQYNRLAGANDALLCGETVAGIAHVARGCGTNKDD
jgi:hypothetical protein